MQTKPTDQAIHKREILYTALDLNSKTTMAVEPGRLSRSIILKEGFLYKKGGIIKSWSRRYFVLSPQSLCYFRSEEHMKLEPLGRIFLSDIVSISADGTEKRKAFVFALHTKKRAVLLQGANTDDRDKWIETIHKSLETEQEAENEDPFRKSLRRLTPGIKRVTLFKDPLQGIGCTVKNSAGRIFVNKIIEDGPISETGILRPGDELLDVNGHSVIGLSVNEVTAIIRDTPSQFLATVRPVTSIQKALKEEPSHALYSDVVHFKAGNGRNWLNGQSPPLPVRVTAVDGGDSDDEEVAYAVVNKERQTNNVGRTTTPGFVSCDSPPPPPLPPHSGENSKLNSPPSFEDVGNYDDEDEGDVPPPLPPWTEDAFILVDPPPSAPPKFDIYKTNAHLPPGVVPKRTAHPYQRYSPPHTRPAYVTQLSSPAAKTPKFTTPPSTPHCLRKSPPLLPPPRPIAKGHKAHSQGDSLDKIDDDCRPPLPPRPHKLPNPVFYSPGPRPRRAHHQYRDMDRFAAKNKMPSYIDIELSNKRNVF